MRRFLPTLLLALPMHAAGLGLLTAHGTVKLNGFRTWDNGTVLDNTTVETSEVCARITLNSGVEILLGPAARIRFTHGAIMLESGSSITRSPGSTPVLAGPNAASILRLMDSLVEKRPLSQRP